MTLTFTQENGLYVAEFEASAPFSIHLERPKGGFINVLQRSVDSGTFVAVKNFNPNYNATQVIDADCGQGAVYPKWIRLESAVEPSVAEVTFEDEQSGGGAGTAESTMEYLDVSGVDNTIKQLLITFSLLDKIPNTVKVNIPVDDGTRTVTLKQGIAPGANVGIIMGQVGLDNPDLAMIINGITALSIDFQMNLDIDGQKLPISEFFVLYGIAETIAAIPRITEEQFYNLEA